MSKNSRRPYVRRQREQDTVSPYVPPVYAVRLGESRMEAFVKAYQSGQQFSAATIALSHRPRPTLLDLAVSAYLQGIEDTVQSCTANGFNFSGGELDEHKYRGHHGNGRSTETTRLATGGRDEAVHQRDRYGEPERAAASATRSDGPHDGFTEFAMSMW